MEKYTIAIIDEEQNQRDQFEFVFSKLFNVVQINSYESTDSLISLIKSENIDAIAIDYRLTEHHSTFKDNGDFLFKEIRKYLFEFPVFILTRSANEVKQICKTVDPSFIVDKKNINFGKGEQEEEKLFLESISTKINIYKSDLQEKIDKLNQLEDLRKNNPREFETFEAEYINLNFELSKYIYGAQIPLTFFTQQSNERLDTLIAKTEDILKKLEEK